jgi:hypothetical protein
LNCGNLDTFASWSSQKVSLLWELWGTLQVDLDTSLAGFILGLLVINLSLQNLLLALGLANVFNAHMNTLFKDTSIDKLVDTDTDGRLGNVEDNSSSSVVDLVWHTLVDRRISKDINVVTNLDLHQILRKVDRSVLTVLLSKHMARTRSCSEGVRHLVVVVLVK